MNNTGFPQAGIISSLDTAGRRAKVFLPLFKIETGWIPVASNLLYETQVSLHQIQINSPAATTVEASSGTVDAPASCPGTFATWAAAALNADQVNAPSGSVGRVDYGTLKVGDEVAVIFLNGDVNQGRVIARF
ncbi:MAG TPA: hypothetical protein VN426_06100 [Syntrophomonadaceae bacterium]|nr:hypothetical protein [Syntrophomonadaceae bacterium]